MYLFNSTNAYKKKRWRKWGFYFKILTTIGIIVGILGYSVKDIRNEFVGQKPNKDTVTLKVNNNINTTSQDGNIFYVSNVMNTSIIQYFSIPPLPDPEPKNNTLPESNLDISIPKSEKRQLYVYSNFSTVIKIQLGNIFRTLMPNDTLKFTVAPGITDRYFDIKLFKDERIIFEETIDLPTPGIFTYTAENPYGKGKGSIVFLSKERRNQWVVGISSDLHKEYYGETSIDHCNNNSFRFTVFYGDYIFLAKNENKKDEKKDGDFYIREGLIDTIRL